ncbi:MAG: 1-deoxy-D-xylulose-5-phosphate reductoisomerase [Actinomycetota bacterium]
MTSVSILGSTGSIGLQTLEVIDAEPERFSVAALSASSSIDALIAQAKKYRPHLVIVANERDVHRVQQALPGGCEVACGVDGLVAASELADVTVNAIVGFAGLPVTIATLKAGKRLALANKESLITAAPVVERVRYTRGASLIPVDSEHCAIFQCLGASHGENPQVARLILTASGGPFRGRDAVSLEGVTVEDALQHPTWSMGPKITVDSSTLMNKGLEVIEAHALFGTPYDQIDVVVHPQSIVHSMVEFTDGTTIAQLSMPDMRLPIGYALSYPDRLQTPFGGLDLLTSSTLTFEPPDRSTFRCLDLAFAAGRMGGAAPAWLSAANEVAVEEFLAGRLEWAQISEVVSRTMDLYEADPLDTVDAVYEADAHSRSAARSVVGVMRSVHE